MTETPHTDPSQEDGEASTEETLPAKPRSTQPTQISDDDYDAIADAVMETERGRWFLKEYARRNRNADTEAVLAALTRVEERLDQANPSDDSSVALISHNVIDLAEAITDVKREVEELGAGDKGDHFNNATTELDAIVSQTETATGEILESAEKIQEVLWTLREGGADETQCDIIETKIIDIYTACSFQDLTGQRSSKVVRLVGYVEKRVQSMMEILGLATPSREDTAATTDASEGDAGDDARAAYQEDDDRSDAHLLHGPSMDGEGIEQDDVDALFGDGNNNLEPSVQDDDTAVFERAHAAIAQASEAVGDFDASGETDGFVDEGDVAELQDAEIIGDSDDAVSEDFFAVVSETEGQAQDIFEVDQVTFDGLDMSERDTVNDDDINPSTTSRDAGQARLLVIRTPDEFDLEDGAADMYVDEGPVEEVDGEEESVSELTESYQDIFEVEDFDLAEDVGTTEDQLDDALIEEAAIDDGEAVSAPAEPPAETKDDAESVGYTDEERIALFS